MPETHQGKPAACQLVHFVDRPEQVPPAMPWVGLGDYLLAPGSTGDLSAVVRNDEEAIKQSFIRWVGEINVRNACRAWWAHTTSAKNILSSPFGNRVLETLAVKRWIEEAPQARVAIVGATAGQVRALRSAPIAVRSEGAGRSAEGALGAVSRLAYQAVRIFAARVFLLGGRPSGVPDADVHIVTYADERFRHDQDAFFGPLAEMLGALGPPRRVAFHAFIHGRYRRVMARLRSARRHSYRPLFAALCISQVIRAFVDALVAVSRVRRWAAPARLGGMDFSGVLREALYWDFARGGYFYNLLVYYAARRMTSSRGAPCLVYPFENKALEKMLLLGAREANRSVRITGYQHSAVTPRHVTLLFAPGEAEVTPLPDAIYTVGDVTRQYLESNGNYPPRMLSTGFSLRQAAAATVASTPSEIRILFALSSSVSELVGAAHCLVGLAALRPVWKFAIRPHPEFPLQRLPGSLARRVQEVAMDVGGTPLEENLEWASAVVYASSTVALEALMAGRPVVNVAVGDLLSVDPVLEPLRLHRAASGAAELAESLEQLASMSADELQEAREEAKAFTDRYFVAPTLARLEQAVFEARA